MAHKWTKDFDVLCEQWFHLYQWINSLLVHDILTKEHNDNNILQIILGKNVVPSLKNWTTTTNICPCWKVSASTMLCIV